MKLLTRAEPTENVAAHEIEVGDVIIASPVGAPRRRWWGLGPRPKVTYTNYLEDGEGGYPTVYVETADMPGWTYCMDPEDRVTVLASADGR